VLFDDFVVQSLYSCEPGVLHFCLTFVIRSLYQECALFGDLFSFFVIHGLYSCRARVFFFADFFFWMNSLGSYSGA